MVWPVVRSVLPVKSQSVLSIPWEEPRPAYAMPPVASHPSTTYPVPLVLLSKIHLTKREAAGRGRDADRGGNGGLVGVTVVRVGVNQKYAVPAWATLIEATPADNTSAAKVHLVFPHDVLLSDADC